MNLSELNAHELGAVVGSIAALVDVGVLRELASGKVELDALALRTRCDPLALDRIAAVLVAAGLLTREGDALGLAPALLADGAAAPGGLTAVAAHFRRTPEFLRSGTRAPQMDGDTDERQKAYAASVADLGRLFSESAQALAARLGPARRVLDVGAGSGVWSLAMIALTRDGRATALDLAPVLPAFTARAAALGLAERVSTIAGNFHEFEPAAGEFDRVVLANVLHLEQEPAAEALVARARRALLPGGELVVVDMLPTGAFGALAYAAYELHLAMRTRAGRAHPQDKLEQWLRAAGLEPTATIALDGRLRGLSAIVARALT